jgi:hypothetical protein
VRVLDGLVTAGPNGVLPMRAIHLDGSAHSAQLAAIVVPMGHDQRSRRGWRAVLPAMLVIATSAAPAQGLGWRELHQGSFVDGDLAFDRARGRLVAVYGGRTLEWDGWGWHARSTAHAPASRSGLRLAYDEARAVTVMFGGSPEAGRLTDELWEYDGFDWRQRMPASGPVARERHALAYDSLRGRVVLYGGINASGVQFGDTWEWDGTVWTQRFVAGPGPRSETAMAFHAASGRTILFGGADGLGPRNDTWSWDGSAWTLQSPATVPPRRAGHALAPDLVRGCLVLFGGSDPQHWEWWGNDWIAGAAGPPQRRGLGMAPDANGMLVVLGGRTEPQGNYQTQALGDMWAFDGVQWLQLRATGPQPRSGGAMDYDPGRDRLVFVGGGSSLVTPTHVWEWDGATWTEIVPPTEPPYLLLARYCHDRRRGVGVLFGGMAGFPFAYGRTHEWNGSAWTDPRPPVSPAPRFEHAMAYDEARGFVLLFGGRDLFTTYGDTWTWDGTNWRTVATTGPSVRSGTAMAADARRARVVLFGGGLFTGSNPVLATGDTWEWDGVTWTQRQPAVAPPPRSRHSLAFDRTRNVTVLCGGWNGSRELREVWEWDGASWSGGMQPLPEVRDCHLVHHDGSGRMLLLAPVFGGGVQIANDLWLGSPQPARAAGGGSGCGGLLELQAFGPPVVGRPGFALDLRSAPFSAALVGVGTALGNQPLGGGCTLHVQAPVLAVPVALGAGGFGTLQIPVPANPALTGMDVVYQAGSPRTASPTGFALSPYVVVRLGD